MHLIIYGPEGSGKGTQAEFLSKHYSLPIFTSGDLVREAASGRHDKTGKLCQEALSIGKYVDDEVMFELWKEKLNSLQARRGFILDGFPRNVHQAEFLWGVLTQIGISIDFFIHLDISDRQAFLRLSKRSRKLFNGSKVTHDTPELIAKRLQNYRLMEGETLDFFREKNVLISVNGEQEIQKVYQDIISQLTNKG